MTIDFIPNEVLTNIFLCGTIQWATHNHDTRPFIFDVCGVSRHWYELALNTPELWKHIYIPLHQEHIDPISWSTLWIKRSKSCLIDIVLPSSQNHADFTTMSKHFDGLMSLIVKNMARIRSLEITTWFPSTINTMKVAAYLNACLAPSLENLALISQGDNNSSSFSSSRSQFTTPRLSSLHLQGANLSVSLVSLTTLTLHQLSATYDDIHALFSSALGLRGLVLSNLPPSPELPAHQLCTIDASSLRSLAFNYRRRGLDTTFSILGFLSMPNLKYLEVHGPVSISKSLQYPLSSARIQTLRLCNYARFIQPDIEFLLSLSSITCLELINAPTQGMLSLNNAHQSSLRRRPSIDFRKPKSIIAEGAWGLASKAKIDDLHEPPSSVTWPNLRTIKLDTLVAANVVWLCTIVAARKSIKVVEITAPVKRHLASSLARDANKFRRLNIGEGNGESFEKWLEHQVEVHDFEVESTGLLRQH